MSKFFLLLPRIGFGDSLNRYIFLYILSHPLSITEPIAYLSLSNVGSNTPKSADLMLTLRRG